MSFQPRPKQAEVLAYAGGKMGISAVPGSGKTQTLCSSQRRWWLEAVLPAIRRS
jgi:DNA helicase-2/ATP-dependent DNA helicase PcrA